MEKNIKIYTLSWCHHCSALKEFLKEEKIEFENIDMEENEEEAENIIEKTGQSGFPIIEIDDILIIGFNKNKIKGILKDD